MSTISSANSATSMNLSDKQVTECQELLKKLIQARLFKYWIVLSTGFITIQQINIREANCVIQWIEIYSVDSIIHFSNNWHLDIIEKLQKQASA